MPDYRATDAIENLLSKKLNKQIKVLDSKPLSGGCINRAECIKTSFGDFCVKFNSKKQYPGMFEAEGKGLELLASAGAISIPGVVGAGSSEDVSFLVLEYIPTGVMAKGFWEDFGRSMAILHSISATQFGLDHDNYIGSLGQRNTQSNSWPQFFIKHRLEAQVQMANISSATKDMFEQLYARIDSLFPDEPPALLHGDLWSGNYMVGPDGKPVIIDPAVYYGNREMDLGMTRLFGGFDSAFYTAYNEEYPLEPGWEDRLDICNLYPLMVHVNLFGGGYLSQVQSILSRVLFL